MICILAYTNTIIYSKARLDSRLDKQKRATYDRPALSFATQLLI